MRHFDVLGVVVLVGGVIGAGCNAITGSGDLLVVGGGAGAGSPTGTGAGNGGAGGTSGETSSSTGMPVTQCTYPTTGLGFSVGDVVPPKHSWQGFPDGSLATATPATVKLDDYFDCDGSRGITAVLVDTSALWCGACQQEAAGLDAEIKGSWAALGIRVITLLVDGNTQGVGATIPDVKTWKTMFKLDTSTVVMDPNFTFAPPGAMTIGLPVEVVLDPRTMKIVDSQQGYSGDYSTLVALAKKNAVK